MGPSNNVHPCVGTSNIKHQTSNIKHQTSNIKHQTSNIKHQTSSAKHQTSNIKHQTSNIKRQTSSAKHQAPNIKQHQAQLRKHQTSSTAKTSNIKHQAQPVARSACIRGTYRFDSEHNSAMAGWPSIDPCMQPDLKISAASQQRTRQAGKKSWSRSCMHVRCCVTRVSVSVPVLCGGLRLALACPVSRVYDDNG
jgi:hypothetical protein